MTGKTHASFGLLIGAYFSKDYGVSIETVGIVSASLLGSLIPDVCHTKSTIGRRLPLISWLVNLLFGHRTFTHSLLFMLLMYLVLTLFGLPDVYIIPFVLGIASHIFLDFLTDSGVSLFYPYKNRFSSPINVKTGGITDYSLLVVFLCCVYLVYR